MSVRFLLFSGNLVDEGNFYLLETKESIILLASGKGLLPVETKEQKIGRDYLKENINKVKAIIVNNTNWQNISLLKDVCYDLKNSIPIYTSSFSKLILFSIPLNLRNKIIIVEKNKEIKIGDFFCSFLLLGSHLVGNLALKINYLEYSFFFLESFAFSNLIDNNLLFPFNFLEDFYEFLKQRNKSTYLITSCKGLRWKKNNSLFFATKDFLKHDKILFFILYDFDWLHILELLEIMQKQKKNVFILNREFSALINRILIKDPLNKVIKQQEENEIIKNETVYLLVSNPENIEKRIKDCLDNFSPRIKNNFHFVVGTPPIKGGEEKLARLIDYLYVQSPEVTNLSKKDYVDLGTSFYDFKLLIKLLKPTEVITLQNSYKDSNFFVHLSGKFSRIKNGHAWELPTRKISLLEKQKTSINLEELLIKQRESIRKTGLLIVLFVTEWNKETLELKKIRIEPLAMNLLLNISELEKKIKNWWTDRLVYGIKPSDPEKVRKRAIEKRLNEKIKHYLSLKQNIDLEECIMLLFYSSSL
ncbi:hypothetical protein [endosymbiont GvMRE of Glomus versiforme]|uniref:hypothetical protein n=1 Tax=endosymbiont GvMRE of Glomus versiforme TaxID=2039283 RepID=UPI000ED8075A|nr:hypothetical protein [endosymbiont GvMRE of Glomus versiforme]RHZ35204.1 Metallo-beta-lactamase [endosymbiont GvMRE of Glomus versiforme]